MSWESSAHDGIGALTEERDQIPLSLSLSSLPPNPSMWKHVRSWSNSQEKISHQEPNWLAPWSWTSRNVRNKNVCCLSRLRCLWKQPELTHLLSCSSSSWPWVRLLKIPEALLRAAVPTMGGGTNAPEVRAKLCHRNPTARLPSDHDDIFQTA